MPPHNFVLLSGSNRSAPTDVTLRRPLSGTEKIAATLVLRRKAELPGEVIAGNHTLTPVQLAEKYGAAVDDFLLVKTVLDNWGIEVLSFDADSRRVHVEGSVTAVREAFGGDLYTTVLTETPTTTDSENVPTGQNVTPRGTNLRQGTQHPTDNTETATSESSVTSTSVEPYRFRTGHLHVPAELEGIIIAVLGLDNRPQARSRLKILPAHARTVSYTPPELASLYNFPSEHDGTGHTLAIIELGGGFSPQELQRYFDQLGIPSPRVTAVSVGGAHNAPTGDPNGPDGEVVLDIQIAGAIAYGADIVVYFAPNSDQGFLNAVSEAIHAHRTPSAISISWGMPEVQWTEQARDAMNEAFADAAARGITVTAAAGDSGSSDGLRRGSSVTDFPASSPYVLGCGGTKLLADPRTGEIFSETVWNAGPFGGATGGGVSEAFAKPQWQSQVEVPGRGRGVPDVAAVADPATGYEILVDGHSTVVGGTSAVAPLWAALLCRIAQAVGHRLGFVQPHLYPSEQTPRIDLSQVDVQTALPRQVTTEFSETAQDNKREAGARVRIPTYPGFRDITEGNNGAFSAAQGWDACTGLGVPDGVALLEVFRQRIQAHSTSTTITGAQQSSVDRENWRHGADASRDQELLRERPPHW